MINLCYVIKVTKVMFNLLSYGRPVGRKLVKYLKNERRMYDRHKCISGGFNGYVALFDDNV